MPHLSYDLYKQPTNVEDTLAELPRLKLEADLLLKGLTQSKVKDFQQYLKSKNLVSDTVRAMASNVHLCKRAAKNQMIRQACQYFFGFDFLEDGMMFALHYQEWFNGSQKIYLIDEALYQDILAPIENPKKFQEQLLLGIKMNPIIEKIQTQVSLAKGSLGLEHLESPQVQTLMRELDNIEVEIESHESWCAGLPPLSQLTEPILVIAPTGRIVLLSPMVPNYNNMDMRLQKLNLSLNKRVALKTIRQAMINAHKIANQHTTILASVPYLLQDAKDKKFCWHFSASLVPELDHIKCELTSDAKQKDSNSAEVVFEHNPNALLDDSKLHQLLVFRKETLEASRFLSALQSPKTIVTRIGNSKRKKNKRFGKKSYNPTIATIKVDTETLNVIRPLRIKENDSDAPKREMPRFEVDAKPARRWVLENSLQAGEEILATKISPKSGNRLYFVWRHQAGYIANQHKEPKEKQPKIIRAKKFLG